MTWSTKAEKDTEVNMVTKEYFEAATMLMDDEIRERLHFEMAPCTDDEFLEAYLKAHFEKYGEEFVVN